MYFKREAFSNSPKSKAYQLPSLYKALGKKQKKEKRKKSVPLEWAWAYQGKENKVVENGQRTFASDWPKMRSCVFVGLGFPFIFRFFFSSTSFLQLTKRHFISSGFLGQWRRPKFHNIISYTNFILFPLGLHTNCLISGRTTWIIDMGLMERSPNPHGSQHISWFNFFILIIVRVILDQFFYGNFRSKLGVK